MERSRSSSRFLPLVCASLAILLGLLTLAGWTSGLSILASLRAKYIPMAPSTALCFSLIGVGLIQQLTIPRLGRVAWLLSIIVLVVACAKLTEFLGGINFGIDAWFVRNPGRFGAVPTGRMSLITAANFIFTAAGLFVLARPCLQKWAGIFGAVATAVAAVVLTGYCYGTPLLYRRRGAMAAAHVSRRFNAGTAVAHFRAVDRRRLADQRLYQYHAASTLAR
jgi:hypothetical protein